MDIGMFKRAMTTLGKQFSWSPDFSDPDVVNVWWSSLREVPDETLRQSCQLAVETLRRFPSLAEFRELCAGKVLDDTQVGADVSARIEGAIKRFGYSNPARAEEYIGELGWEVVRNFGGWTSICDVTNSELISLRKQWRETAEILHKKYRAFGGDPGPSLPAMKHPALKAALDLIDGGKVG